MYKRNFITVDPGKGGGLCWTNHSGEVYAARCPENDPRKMIKLVKQIRSMTFDDRNVVIEKQHAMPSDTPKRAFILGANYYMWIMAFTGCKIPITFITPKKWQKRTGLKLPPGRENYNIRKGLLKNYGIQGFPNGLPVWEWKGDEFVERKGIVTGANGDAVAMLRALGSEI